MKWSELKRILHNNGWYLCRFGAKHDLYAHETQEGIIAVGRHDSEEIPKGTCRQILKQLNNNKN